MDIAIDERKAGGSTHQSELVNIPQKYTSANSLNHIVKKFFHLIFLIFAQFFFLYIYEVSKPYLEGLTGCR